MKATNSAYDVAASSTRIKETLDESDAVFKEVNEIPSSDTLTYDNGYYVNCTALFIDIRGSSQLPDIHTRPVLGKIYRAYISECVAVINENPNCREVFISGDCVSGIFNSPYKNDIDSAFETAARLCSLVHVLNWQLEKKGYATIECGVGLSYGRALMIKAGYKGSGINDIVWMGDVVNEAAKLCHMGNKNGLQMVQIANDVRFNLKEQYQNLLSPVFLGVNSAVKQYQGTLYNVGMNNWLDQQQASDRNIAALVAALFSYKPPASGLLASTLLTGK